MGLQQQLLKTKTHTSMLLPKSHTCLGFFCSFVFEEYLTVTILHESNHPHYCFSLTKNISLKTLQPVVWYTYHDKRTDNCEVIPLCQPAYAIGALKVTVNINVVTTTMIKTQLASIISIYQPPFFSLGQNLTTLKSEILYHEHISTTQNHRNGFCLHISWQTRKANV